MNLDKRKEAVSKAMNLNTEVLSYRETQSVDIQ